MAILCAQCPSLKALLTLTRTSPSLASPALKIKLRQSHCGVQRPKRSSNAAHIVETPAGEPSSGPLLIKRFTALATILHFGTEWDDGEANIKASSLMDWENAIGGKELAGACARTDWQSVSI